MRKVLKFMNIIFVFAALLSLVLSGCSINGLETNNDDSTYSKENGFSNITPEEAKKRLDKEKNIVVLDVRTQEEYETGHIKGSVLIPVDKLKEESEKSLADKEVPIFIYCRSGNRSTAAAKILVEQGYKNVYNLGGINKWPYDVEMKQ